MENNEQILNKLDEKFDQLNKRITALQDFVLYMKTDFDLIARTKMENEFIKELTSLIEINLNHFLDERLQTCGALDHCTVFIQQSSIKILRVYMKKGIKSALKLLDSYIDYLKKYREAGRCSDNKCMKNAIKIFKSLNEIIDFSEQKALKHKQAIFSRLKEYNFSEIDEKIESNLLYPLSNETRLKILKILSKGGAYYSQLERQVGLKGGHFYFHLDKLINAGYITHEENKSLYSITTDGLKALKFLFELSQELSG